MTTARSTVSMGSIRCKLTLILLAALANVALSAEVQFKVAKDAPIHDDIDTVFSKRIRRSLGAGTDSGEPGNSILIPTKLSSEDQATCLIKHNTYRASENGANELQLTWNDTLASVAQAWAEQCEWKHGMLYDPDGERVGQNMFMSGGGTVYPPLNTAFAIEEWFVEKQYYHYGDKSCDGNEMCGHYTQVVWAKSAQLGCGYAKCPKVLVSGQTWTNVVMFVCDYSPPGNVQGEQIYEKGTPCSECASSIGVTNMEGFKCESNLCVPCLPRHDSSCQCGSAVSAGDCKNGGSFSDLDCVCNCASGFYGQHCENSCQCADLYADVCPQWKGFCGDPSYLDFMKANCPVTCGLCATPDSCNNP